MGGIGVFAADMVSEGFEAFEGVGSGGVGTASCETEAEESLAKICP